MGPRPAVLVAIAAAVAGPAPAGAAVRITSRSVTLTTSQGSATVARSPFGLRFADRGRRTVLRQAPVTDDTLVLSPPPPPLVPTYGPPLQPTLYAPLAFTVGQETTTTQEAGQWSGNLLSKKLPRIRRSQRMSLKGI